jgi:dihydrofolate reductase
MPHQAPGALHVTIVVAMGRNRVIGSEGDMPWQMPTSLRNFRKLTMGRPMIMGRKTFQSIGKALDGRDTIVVTRNRGFAADGVHSTTSLAEALRLAATLAARRGVDEVIIAGGGEIYALALPYATRAIVDVIDAEPVGDTVFPELDTADWRLVSTVPLARLPKDEFPASVATYERIGVVKSLPET